MTCGPHWTCMTFTCSGLKKANAHKTPLANVAVTAMVQFMVQRPVLIEDIEQYLLQPLACLHW